MATGGTSSDDEIIEVLQKLKVEDKCKDIITVACWNIMGKARADQRKKVVSHNFMNHKLGLQADIICLQEVPVQCSGRTFTKYVPVNFPDYGYEECEEPGSAKYNVVLHKKEKFETLDTESRLKNAFLLIEVKRKTYEAINRGGDEIKTKAINEKLNDDWKKRMLAELKVGDLKDICTKQEIAVKQCIDEVLKECARCSHVAEFDELLSRYKAPKEAETKSPKTLLERRVAMTLLRKKPISCAPTTSHNILLLVISIHSYGGTKSGKKSQERFNCLFFDFLEKLSMLNINIPVLIAGDFNQDICSTPSLAQFLSTSRYVIHQYSLAKLRCSLPRIDFILLRHAEPPQFNLSEVKAIDFTVPPEVEKDLKGHEKMDKYRSITNHSPLTSTLELL